MASTAPVPAHPDCLPLFAEARGDIAVSFEFFPPKSEKMADTLWESIKTLEPLDPRFVSVTYGAGGSTRERTHQTVERILKETGLTPAAHLTCVGASRAEIDAIARDYWELGVRNIVALRGDPPEIGRGFEAHPQGYRDAAELVTGLKQVAPFDISVACYPECHPEALSAQADIEHLKRKVDAGADRAITQFFFSADCFFAFRDRVAAAGLDVEIVPGILPVTNVAQARKFAGQCGASNVTFRRNDKCLQQCGLLFDHLPNACKFLRILLPLGDLRIQFLRGCCLLELLAKLLDARPDASNAFFE